MLPKLSKTTWIFCIPNAEKHFYKQGNPTKFSHLHTKIRLTKQSSFFLCMQTNLSPCLCDASLNNQHVEAELHCHYYDYEGNYTPNYKLIKCNQGTLNTLAKNLATKVSHCGIFALVACTHYLFSKLVHTM